MVLDPDRTDYLRFTTSLSLPVILDVKFSESFLLRIQHEVASVYFDTETDGSPATTDTTIGFDSYHNGAISIELGFMFLF